MARNSIHKLTSLFKFLYSAKKLENLKTSFYVNFLFNNYLKKCKDNLDTGSLKIFIVSQNNNL